MSNKNLKVVFHSLFEDQKIIQETLKGIPLINPDLAQMACRSLEKVAPLVQNPRELEYYGLLLSVARDLLTSSEDGKKIFTLFVMCTKANSSVYRSHQDL